MDTSPVDMVTSRHATISLNFPWSSHTKVQGLVEIASPIRREAERVTNDAALRARPFHSRVRCIHTCTPPEAFSGSPIVLSAQYPPSGTPYWAEISIDPVYLKLPSQSAKPSHTVGDRSITKFADHRLFRPRKSQEVDSVSACQVDGSASRDLTRYHRPQLEPLAWIMSAACSTLLIPRQIIRPLAHGRAPTDNRRILISRV